METVRPFRDVTRSPAWAYYYSHGRLRRRRWQRKRWRRRHRRLWTTQVKGCAVMVAEFCGGSYGGGGLGGRACGWCRRNGSRRWVVAHCGERSQTSGRHADADAATAAVAAITRAIRAQFCIRTKNSVHTPVLKFARLRGRATRTREHTHARASSAGSIDFDARTHPHTGATTA